MTALLNVDALRVTYGGVTAVNDVDLTVAAGKVVGLIGPNGAGKTSTIDALTGYHAPAQRHASCFDGEDITRAAPAPARPPRARAHVPVASSCSTTSRSRRTCSSPASAWACCTALRDLLLPIGEHPRDDVDWALELCGLTDVADRLPTELSHGRRKLVGVARALAQRPRLVLMDEPAAGLDTDESARARRAPARAARRGRDRAARRPRHGSRAERLRRGRRARLRPGHRPRHARADPQRRGRRRRLPRQPPRGGRMPDARCCARRRSTRATTARRSCATSRSHVDAGEVVALLGPNGAGKTTTLATIAGLLPCIGGTRRARRRRHRRRARPQARAPRRRRSSPRAARCSSA